MRLERGDATGVSEASRRLARALQLDEAERAHLFDLLRTAGAPRPRPPARRRASRPARRVQRLLDSMHDVPAVVHNGRLDMLAANPLGRALFAPVFADPRRPANNARFVFLDPRAATFFRDWDEVADDTVALLRAEAGRDPHDRASPTSSASSPPAATPSASAGPRTTSASTAPA